MTITETQPATAVGPEHERALVERAAACGPTLPMRAARHDHVAGATIRHVALGQRQLAKYCGLTALASAMHRYDMAATRPDEWSA